MNLKEFFKIIFVALTGIAGIIVFSVHGATEGMGGIVNFVFQGVLAMSVLYLMFSAGKEECK